MPQPSPAPYQQSPRNVVRSRSHSASTNQSNSSTEPPSYPPESSRAPPPVYNSRPTQNENTLIAGAIPPPEGVVTRDAKHFVVALTRQPDRSSLQGGGASTEENRPIYGRAGVVAGVVELKEEHGLKLSDVFSVSVRITGKIKLDISEGGTSSFAFLEHTIKLYNTADRPDASRTCPSMLTFSYTLPTTYTENSTIDSPEAIERALPPTYQIAYDGVPGMRAEVKYAIKFKVDRKRLWKLTQTLMLSVPFDYVPRSRPPIPGPGPDASFTAALKQSPEEWTVFVNDVPRREAATNRPVQYAMDTLLANGETVCSSFVLPSTQTFPLSQAIPFHLQLSLSSAPFAPRVQHFTSSNVHPKQSALRRPVTSPTTRASSPNGFLRVPRPSTAPSPSASITLLSLFANPTFGPPPRRGRRATTAIVGLGEGFGGDGAMVFGDPRHGNLGRHPGGITGDPHGNYIGGNRLIDDMEDDGDALRPALGNRSSSLGPSRGGRPATTMARPTVVSRLQEGSGQRPATSTGATIRRDASPALTNQEGTNQIRQEDVAYIRVFLQRQIVVTVKGQKVVKTIACGDGKLHRITLDNPPTFGDLDGGQDQANYVSEISRQSSPRRSRSLSPQRLSREGLDYIAWEGHVLPNSKILTVGGFRATNLWVKDFITLTMVPPNPEESPLRALHHAVPVRLVSDPWEEEWWAERRH
ncbi:hypothetical protein FRB96_008463 [Tulasnella sp. 330]|nr:hypothetical protein FRB96_008463 [Tulasnella sp. 330]